MIEEGKKEFSFFVHDLCKYVVTLFNNLERIELLCNRGRIESAARKCESIRYRKIEWDAMLKKVNLGISKYKESQKYNSYLSDIIGSSSATKAVLDSIFNRKDYGKDFISDLLEEKRKMDHWYRVCDKIRTEFPKTC